VRSRCSEVGRSGLASGRRVTPRRSGSPSSCPPPNDRPRPPRALYARESARPRSGLQILVEKGDATLPSVLGGVLLVDLGTIVGEERMRRAWIENELVRGIALLELRLEAPHVV